VEIQYYGANCLKLTTKTATVIIDDNLAKLGLKSITKDDDISLQTNLKVPVEKGRFLIDMPGEYEIAGVSIHGIAARAHMDDDKQKSAVIYTLTTGDARIAVLGHIFPELSDEQVEQIGRVDVAVVPVGDSGFTMDGIGALKVIKDIEPKVVIPVHYADKAIKYEVPQVELADGLKGLAMEPSETLPKYKPATAELTDTTKLIVLERQ